MRDARYALREPEVALEAFDGDAILIDFRTGSYYSLSTTASEIVMALCARRTPTEVSAALLARYPAAPACLDDDVLQLTQRLIADGVLVAEPAAAPAPDHAADLPWGPPPAAYTPPTVERFEDMQEMLLLDPIHDVDLAGWPVQRPADEPPA